MKKFLLLLLLALSSNLAFADSGLLSSGIPNSVPAVRLISSSLDMTNTGVVLAVTNNTGLNFVCTGIVVFADTLTAVTGQPTINIEDSGGHLIGQNGIGLNMSSSATFSQYTDFPVQPTSSGASPIIPNGSVINVHVTARALATSYMIHIEFIGYLK